MYGCMNIPMDVLKNICNDRNMEVPMALHVPAQKAPVPTPKCKKFAYLKFTSTPKGTGNILENL